MTWRLVEKKDHALLQVLFRAEKGPSCYWSLLYSMRGPVLLANQKERLAIFGPEPSKKK